MKERRLELLSPAANSATAIEAIKHGADAVYIGPPSHGARKSVSNSIEEIERVVDFAHKFRAKVYATVNTIVYDHEIKQVEGLCRDLYHAGVDALIVQDMGLLRMKLPPIALHASTQCDIRSPEKAKFLEEVGFSQIVLARELTLKEIKEICDAVSIPVETFVHGALCVSYSGRCHASYALTGRSANRGECAQICRLPYILEDSSGRALTPPRYLLSLKDFNASERLPQLIEAGVSSFKIEGRLKDVSYVKNITSFYNLKLNQIISRQEGLRRSSCGKVELMFDPNPEKSFNRGFTHYFLDSEKPLKIASLLTPKSIGEKIENVEMLNNGDGIGFFDKNRNFTGVNVNRIENGRIISGRKVEIPKKATLYRTNDIQWEKLMSRETASRKIRVDLKIDNTGITASDERDNRVRVALDLAYEEAKKPIDYKSIFGKLGNTDYYLGTLSVVIDRSRFYRISDLTAVKRALLTLLEKANNATYKYEYRREENKDVKYPIAEVDFKENISNENAATFYWEHGVSKYEKAAEAGRSIKRGDVVMTTRHCALRELGMCIKEKGKPCDVKFPLYLKYDRGRFQLNFDCQACRMEVIKGS